MTVTRMVVVLRSELGHQLGFATQAFKEAEDELSYKRHDARAIKKLDAIRRSRERLQDAVNALGALTLGDIISDIEL